MKVRKLLVCLMLASILPAQAGPPAPARAGGRILLSGRARQRTAATACGLADGSFLLASEWRRRTNLRRVSIHQCRGVPTWRCGPPADLAVPGTFWTRDHPVLACGPGGAILVATRLRRLKPGPSRIEVFRIQPCRGRRCRPRFAPWATFRPKEGDWAPGGAWFRGRKLALSAGRVGRGDQGGCILLECSPGRCREVARGPDEAAECSMAELADGTLVAVFRNKDARRKWCEWAWKRRSDGSWHHARQGLGACRPGLVLARDGRSALQALSVRRAGYWKVLAARLEVGPSGGRVQWGRCGPGITRHRILAPVLVAGHRRVLAVYAFEAEAFHFETRAAPCPWAIPYLAPRRSRP